MYYIRPSFYTSDLFYSHKSPDRHELAHLMQ